MTSWRTDRLCAFAASYSSSVSICFEPADHRANEPVGRRSCAAACRCPGTDSLRDRSACRIEIADRATRPRGRDECVGRCRARSTRRLRPSRRWSAPRGNVIGTTCTSPRAILSTTSRAVIGAIEPVLPALSARAWPLCHRATRNVSASRTTPAATSRSPMPGALVPAGMSTQLLALRVAAERLGRPRRHEVHRRPHPARPGARAAATGQRVSAWSVAGSRSSSHPTPCIQVVLQDHGRRGGVEPRFALPPVAFVQGEPALGLAARQPFVVRSSRARRAACARRRRRRRPGRSRRWRNRRGRAGRPTTIAARPSSSAASRSISRPRRPPPWRARSSASSSGRASVRDRIADREADPAASDVDAEHTDPHDQMI